MAAVGGQWVCVATMVDCMGGGLLGFVAVCGCGCGSGWLWLGWIGGCDMEVVGL